MDKDPIAGGVDGSLISLGSSFHNLGVATKNDRSPRVLRDCNAG